MNVHLFNPALTSVPITDKPSSWFFPAKCLRNTCERVDLHLYLKCHSSAGVFQTFC